MTTCALDHAPVRLCSDIAIALHTPPHRVVSLALVARALGATKSLGVLAKAKRLLNARASSSGLSTRTDGVMETPPEALSATVGRESDESAGSEGAMPAEQSVQQVQRDWTLAMESKVHSSDC